MGITSHLLVILQKVVDMQANNGLVLPLLVDENIHYRVARLLYGRHYCHWDVRQLLSQVPILYGVWHPYKHTPWVVHRTFFPVIAQLESLGETQSGARVVAHRKVAYLERLFAGLMVAGYGQRDRLVFKLRSLELEVQQLAAIVAGNRDDAAAQQRYKSRRTGLEILRALYKLLFAQEETSV